MPKTFDHILLLGRPASGKSELIDFLEKTSKEQRQERFHIGNFEAIDDFVWIWEKFEEDNIWEKLGQKRLYSFRTGNDYGLTDGRLFDFMIERFNLETAKRYLSRPEFYNDHTLFIEFARGTGHGYEYSLNQLSPEILKRAAIMYLSVTFEESWRKNVARYQEKLKHSILAHMVPRETMDMFYLEDDWAQVSANNEYGYLTANSVKVPFVTVNNMPEVIKPEEFDERYFPAFQKLMEIYSDK
ncbi:MAG: hypothetical protein ABH859_05430 [Pseudomonadota bacterium]